jgi:hypothetical protein
MILDSLLPRAGQAGSHTQLVPPGQTYQTRTRQGNDALAGLDLESDAIASYERALAFVSSFIGHDNGAASAWSDLYRLVFL